MRKHASWYYNYLFFAQKKWPVMFSVASTTVSNFLTNKSLNGRVTDQIRSFALQHSRFSVKAPLRFIDKLADQYVPALYPTDCSMSMFFNLNLIRSLVLRQYKIRRMLRGYPVRGQRRRSNANTARHCCSFFKQSISAYERELWGYKQVKKKKLLTKLDEARFGAHHRVVKKKKFVTKKIKSRKELVLRRKKRKKTPWR